MGKKYADPLYVVAASKDRKTEYWVAATSTPPIGTCAKVGLNSSAKVIPMLTSYTVTFRGSPTERLSPHALDEVKGLDNALTHALNLIRAGHQDVAIQDGTGKSVSGDLLMACCRGEKELTPDLFS